MNASVILVVEDNTILRHFAIMMVEEDGFDVVGARDTAEALKVLELRSDIRVIFTDVDMGAGKDGIWLALQVRNRWPLIQIIVTSGHHNVTPNLLPSGAVFFAKPYAEDLVMREISRMAA
jgi:DNA-binding NtrC family response regulator